MTDELKLRMTEIARKWMRPDSGAAPEFHWGDFYDCVAEIMGAAGASEGQASSEFVFPPMPHAVVQHEKVGPLFDRLSMQFYAAKCMRSQDAEIAALRERIAGMEKDAIRSLIARHAEELEQNDYAYFELAYTRRTGWMAWICSNSRDDDPNRKVIACGQGDTPDEACNAAIAKEPK